MRSPFESIRNDDDDDDESSSADEDFPIVISGSRMDRDIEEATADFREGPDTKGVRLDRLTNSEEQDPMMRNFKTRETIVDQSAYDEQTRFF